MASLIGKVTAFARTPQGRRLVSEATKRAQAVSKDPATKAKIEKLRTNITRRR